MFARVFDTAKRILSRSPSYQGESEEANHTIPRSSQSAAAEDEDMVTTRRGTGTGPSVESTPASSTRRTRGKRYLEAEVYGTPTTSKRRRKAARDKEALAEDTVEAQDSTDAPTDGEKNDDPDSITKTMPHRTKNNETIDSAEASTPVARRNSPKILIPTPSKDSTDEAHESETTSSQVDVFFTPAQQSFSIALGEEEREGSLTPKPAAKTTPASGKGSGKRGRPRKNPAPASPEKSPTEPTLPDEIPSSTWNSEQAALSPAKNDDESPVVAEEANAKEGDKISETQEEQDAATVQPSLNSEPAKDQVQDLASLGIAYEDVAPDTTIIPPRRHKRFDSEEPADFAEPNVRIEIRDDDASDSDEAPEMVTTSAAASKAKAAAEETSRALQAQQAKEEKRRQERADRIAQEQAEKREREQKKARKLAKTQAKLARRQQREVSSPARDPMDVDMNDHPDLLPDSILEAAGDRRPPTPPPVRVGKTEEELKREKLNRHIKFLDRGEKPIKDVKKGKVNVSVLAQRNMLLAPKVNRDTKNIREHWLKGREADRKSRGGRKGMNFKKMERRATGGGFLRGGDDD